MTENPLEEAHRLINNIVNPIMGLPTGNPQVVYDRQGGRLLLYWSRGKKYAIFPLSAAGVTGVDGIVGGRYNMSARDAADLLHRLRVLTDAQFSVFMKWWQQEQAVVDERHSLTQLKDLANKLGYTLTKKET